MRESTKAYDELKPICQLGVSKKEIMHRVEEWMSWRDMKRYDVSGRCNVLFNYVWSIRVIKSRDECSKSTTNVRFTTWPDHATNTIKARLDALCPLNDQIARSSNAMDMISVANAFVLIELNMSVVIFFRKEKIYKSQDVAIVKNELLDSTRLDLH